MIARSALLLILGLLTLPWQPSGETTVTYPAKPGPGKGRHVVLLTGDEVRPNRLSDYS